ncbi:MAG: GC-type dockerin domain-anchored protein [Phycisphaerales bacterium]|jgi:hypothetical protein|nr:GC-type dockerin domain-anchored protein [Phycisphaerales bacterium]
MRIGMAEGRFVGAAALAIACVGAQAQVVGMGPPASVAVSAAVWDSIEPAEANEELPVRLTKLERMIVTSTGQVIEEPYRERACDVLVTHSDVSFNGGEYFAQAGFAQTEIFAQSYPVAAGEYPIEVVLAEAIFAAVNATELTTTEWSVLVWDGPPTGAPAYTFSSDDIVLPHILLGPGTQGTLLSFLIDPSDPNRMFLSNANGANQFSVGFRIDKHNSQTGTGCTTAPPSNLNAFPVTDTTGVDSLAGNWLFGVNCGPFGCPPNGGWATFQALFPGICRPSGDWMVRAEWTSLNCTPGVGACCKPDGTCEVAATGACTSMGGVFQGDGVSCASVTCPQQPQACCFAATGGCLNLTPMQCLTAGGVPGGVGTTCATFTCFPKGACCLLDGTCIDNIAPEECLALNGTYKGNNTTCAGTTCPPPVGACCFASGGCLVLAEADCAIAGGSWAGPGTTCADGNQNGTADVCENCPADWDNSGGAPNSSDFLAYLNDWANQDPQADIAPAGGDNAWDSSDFLAYLNLYAQGC